MAQRTPTLRLCVSPPLRLIRFIDSEAAKVLTGSGDPISVPQAPKEESSTAVNSRSQCARYRDQIIAKIEQGLTAQRNYQDLVSDYGFTAKYHSVRRFVGTLISCERATIDCFA